MIIKITILSWFVFIVWRFFVVAHLKSMSGLELLLFKGKDKPPFWYWGLGWSLLITIVLSFASVVWLLFFR